MPVCGWQTQREDAEGGTICRGGSDLPRQRCVRVFRLLQMPRPDGPARFSG